MHIGRLRRHIRLLWGRRCRPIRPRSQPPAPVSIPPAAGWERTCSATAPTLSPPMPSYSGLVWPAYQQWFDDMSSSSSAPVPSIPTSTSFLWQHPDELAKVPPSTPPNFSLEQSRTLISLIVQQLNAFPMTWHIDILARIGSGSRLMHRDFFVPPNSSPALTISLITQALLSFSSPSGIHLVSVSIAPCNTASFD